MSRLEVRLNRRHTPAPSAGANREPVSTFDKRRRQAVSAAGALAERPCAEQTVSARAATLTGRPCRRS